MNRGEEEILSKNILIVPNHDAALLEYVRLFENLPKTLKPIFYITYNSKVSLKIKQLGWGLYGESSQKESLLQSKSIVRRAFKFFLDETKLGCFIQRYILINVMAEKLKASILTRSKKISHIMIENKISTLIIANDRTFGAEAAAAYSARELGIKIVVPAFAYSATYESSFKLRLSKIYDAQYSIDKANIMTCINKGSKAFLRPFVSKAMAELNLKLERPWVLGGGFSDYVLLDSEREKERIISYGGDESKYIVTGIAAHDDLYESYLIKRKLKKIIITENSMMDSKKNLILALPQYYEHKLMDKDSQLIIYRDLFSKLVKLNFNVIVSLHPKASFDDYSWINSVSKNLIISTRPLTELITIANVFVSTYSSTISWALLCEIPCVIVDHPNLNYSDFYSEFHIPVCKTNDELIEILSSELLMRCASERIISSIGVFDGNSRSRIASYI